MFTKEAIMLVESNVSHYPDVHENSLQRNQILHSNFIDPDEEQSVRMQRLIGTILQSHQRIDEVTKTMPVAVPISVVMPLDRSEPVLQPERAVDIPTPIPIANSDPLDPDEEQRKRIHQYINSINQSHKRMDEHIEAIKVVQNNIVEEQQMVRQTLEKLEDPAIQQKLDHIEELKEDIQELHDQIKAQQIEVKEELYDIQQKQQAIQDNLNQLANEKELFSEVNHSIQEMAVNAKSDLIKSAESIKDFTKGGVAAINGVAQYSLNCLTNIPDTICYKVTDYMWSLIEDALLHPITLLALAILIYLAPVAGAVLGSIVICILAKKIYYSIFPYLPLALQNQQVDG